MADVSHNLAMADVSHTQHELFMQQSKLTVSHTQHELLCNRAS